MVFPNGFETPLRIGRTATKASLAIDATRTTRNIIEASNCKLYHTALSYPNPMMPSSRGAQDDDL